MLPQARQTVNGALSNIQGCYNVVGAAQPPHCPP